MEIKGKDQIDQVLFAFLVFENFAFPLKVRLLVKKMLSLLP